MVEHVVSLLEDRTLCNRLGVQGRQHVELMFSLPARRAALRALYAELGNALVTDEALAFAHAVTRLLDDEEAAVRLGANGRKTVEESFFWECVTESLLAAYTDTVNGRCV